ncbi:hypothetical protein KGF54_000788 [Candida jiufengensis]|uniref:uncharacterized protein n=1 Tax=Candida jiufengensis TaxID=497108 RepID=UPI00222460A0|nr:uncharacterized protein KGF54_000788 [Candida jiufengensis]KAI5956313.1 hypothetical protein KGF54_000788 [Candida jiufengensis]
MFKSNNSVSAKNKKYTQSIEKVLLSFESLEEWADYIAFLSRLQKVITTYIDLESFFVPEAQQVSYRLSLCLSSTLPNGVHQKALNIYELIIDKLSIDQINVEINIWLPGLLPLFSYSSISLKPQQISLFQSLIINKLNSDSLSRLTKPIILSLLSGLEDENSEIFQDVLNLLNAFKIKLNNDSKLWQCMFLCVISNPERRVGALQWCDRYLPQFTNTKEDWLSKEAELCLKPEAGLLIRMFAIAIKDSDTLITRGFLDLLLTRLPLDSKIFDSTISPKDKQLLIMSCCYVLGKDMSLNRRVWNYFLGPETENLRQEYFRNNALELLSKGLIELISSSSTEHKLRALDISFYLVMDKWEINQELTSKLFSPYLNVCYQEAGLTKNSLRFFEEVESSYVWKEIINIILNDEYEKLDFVFKNFNLSEDEKSGFFALMGIACLLSEDLDERKLETVDSLFTLIPKKSLPSTRLDQSLSKIDIVDSWKNSEYYKEEELVSYIMTTLMSVYSSHFDMVHGTKIGTLLIKFFDVIESSEIKSECTSLLLHNWTDQPKSSIPISLDRLKIFNHVSKYVNDQDKDRFLNHSLTNLWASVISPSSTNFQPEVVKCLFDLRFTFPIHKLTGAILELFVDLSVNQKITAFETIWNYSSNLEEANQVLERQFQLIMDDVGDEDGNNDLVNESVSTLVTRLVDDNFSRLVNLVLSPMINNGFETSSPLENISDLNFHIYCLDILIRLLSLGGKPFKNHLANVQFSQKENMSYKVYLITVLNQSLKAHTNNELLDKSIYLSLRLYSKLITGYEKNFSHLFNELLDDSINYINLQLNISSAESTIAEYFQTILHFLQFGSKSYLLHVKEQEKEPVIIKLIHLGIEKCDSPLLLEKCMALMRKSVHVFGESVFSILLALNDSLILKINNLFDKLIRLDDTENIESSLFVLFDGLESLLTITHGHLVRPHMKDKLDKSVPDQGFLNNVMQGVFQIESPSARTNEQDKLYSTLIAFHDAAKVSFKVWNWADSKGATERSLKHVAFNLKLKSRKILQTLIDLERQETVNSIVTSDLSTALKLLSILDGGRSQLTLPYLFNYIKFKCNSMVNDNYRSYIESDVDVTKLSTFLLAFYEFMDLDIILDVWSQTIEFLETIYSNASQFESILPDILRLCKILAVKTNRVKNIKNKNALGDSFTRLFSQYLDTHSEAKEEEVVKVILEFISSFDDIYHDLDKTATAINLCITFIKKNNLKLESISELLLAIGETHITRNWKSITNDYFNDSDFFVKCNNSNWRKIISLWITNDRSKFDEKVSKLLPTSTTSPGALFSWNESSEIEIKVNNLKRVSFLILVQPKDYFVNNLKDIFEKIDGLLDSKNCPTSIRIEITTLIRAIVLKVSDVHLLPHWPMINHELLTIFEKILNYKSPKELQSIPQDYLRLILFGSKLLDELLLIGPDEFNLNSWLFVNIDNFENKQDSISIIDKISLNYDFTFLKNEAFKLNNGGDGFTKDDESKEPLLKGIKEINSITQLRLFFDSLSMIQYERTYSLLPVNHETCIDDIFNDLQ